MRALPVGVSWHPPPNPPARLVLPHKTGAFGANTCVMGRGTLSARMAPHVVSLARQAVAQFAAEVPLYGLLPREELEGEILDVTLHNIRLFFRGLEEGRLPTREEVAGIVASAARRAEERVPLADVLAAYHIGARLGWQAMVDAASPSDADDVAELLAAGSHLLRYMQELTSAVSTAYLDVQQTIHGEERAARQELTEALLSGRPTDALASFADRADVPPPATHVVLVMLVDVPEAGLDAGAAVAARRRERELQATLDGFAGVPVLGRLSGRGGVALLPVASIEGLDDLADDLTKAAGAAVHAAAVVAPAHTDIPGAAGLARDLAELARQLGRPPGLYRMDDLLVEYQLTRPGPARDALARKLDPILDQPQLLDTLRAYVDNGRQRLRTAELLHVHPNTLGYRLGRIATLTNLDPTHAPDAQVLTAALLVL